MCLAQCFGTLILMAVLKRVVVIPLAYKHIPISNKPRRGRTAEAQKRHHRMDGLNSQPINKLAKKIFS
jgi:hypothetical protein